MTEQRDQARAGLQVISSLAPWDGSKKEKFVAGIERGSDWFVYIITRQDSLYGLCIQRLERECLSNTFPSF